MLTGAAAIAISKLSPAMANGSSIAHGMLANNTLAQAFTSPPSDTLPDVTVEGLSGKQPISALLQGRTVIMPVWAEWCTPCLREIPDFALLQREYGGAKFAIIPVLSAPKHKMTPKVIADIFANLNASVFEPLIEDNFGTILASTMANADGGLTFPCNLLIRSDGHVVGRETGMKADAGAQAAGWQSWWGGKDGQELAAALSTGFLN